VFDWLFEGRLSVYVILAAAAVIVAALWSRSGFVLVREVSDGKKSTRHRPAWLPILLAVIVLLAGVYFLLDRLVETPHEQIQRKLLEMAKAVKAKDVDGIFKHISEGFRLGEMNRASFRTTLVEPAIKRVEDLILWDFKFPDESGRVTFFARVTGTGGPDGPFDIRATFVKDADSQWRLQTFEVRSLGGSVIPVEQMR
jgi:hypothetical protein